MSKGPHIFNAVSPEVQKAQLTRKQLLREKAVHRKIRSRIISVFAAIFVILGIQISVKIAQTQRIENEAQASRKTLKKVTQEHKDLSTRRDDLKDPDYVAKMVRYKFYYSKPNEKIYNLPQGQDNN